MDHELPHERITIQDASAWILRGGLIASVLVMLAGIALSFFHRTMTVEEMQRTVFDGRVTSIWHGLREGRGQAVVEVGIYILVFTPIVRVAASMVLFFFEEDDRLYTLLTFTVLILTLTGLLFLR